MNAISFSLWGNNRMYVDGMFENLKLAPQIYPGWRVHIYTDGSTSASTLTQMHQMGAQITTVHHERPPWYNLFLRFLINDDLREGHYIIRDSDSRLSMRERLAVDQWIESGKAFHCMRDHPWHYGVKFLGGLWGCRAGYLPNMHSMVSQYLRERNLNDGQIVKGIDQHFLGECVWPYVVNNRVEHDSLNLAGHNDNTISFPRLREDYHFVGEVFNADNTRQDHYKQLYGLSK